MAKSGVRRIDTRYFDIAIRELNDALDEFNAAFDNIQTQTKRLQAAWDGKGAKQFDSAYNVLKGQFNDQAETLGAIRDDLQAILTTYQEWDAQTESSIAGNTAGE